MTLRAGTRAVSNERWEVAWNPHPIGQLALPEVDG